MYTHILRMNGQRERARREESEKKKRIREIGDGARLLLAAV